MHELAAKVLQSHAVITGVQPSCGCTTPDWTKEPIKPGDKGEIRFSFNSNGRVGVQNKSITVTSNAEKVTETIPNLNLQAPFN